MHPTQPVEIFGKEVLKLMVPNSLSTKWHLPSNVILISAVVANDGLQPEYEPPISTHFGQFQKIGKFRVGALTIPYPPLKEENYT